MSFYLIDNENLQAKERPNGKRGWYYTSMKHPVQGIVVHTAEGGRNAINIAKYLAKTPRPASAHVVINDIDIVDLLPDEYSIPVAAILYVLRSGMESGVNSNVSPRGTRLAHRTIRRSDQN